jgi:hypothetical protein
LWSDTSSLHRPNLSQAKYKQAKAESNTVQTTLQKEITSLRDTNRTLQLKLRDTEVANDDYERQARNTTSSLEDMESKYNVAVERGVLLEEEVKNGEQEREGLRIESQRLRDEFSDLKIEAEIVHEKLRKAESELNRWRKPGHLDAGLATSQFMEPPERSPGTTASSPTVATPPAKSVSSATSDAITPPSPTASESSTSVRKSGIPRGRLSLSDANAASRSAYSSTLHPRQPSAFATPTLTSRQSISKLSAPQSSYIPRSGSLYQIRGLIGKVQKLEERVQSARSRLPAPVATPTGGSPRTPTGFSHPSAIPSSVTLRRSSKKRTSTSSVSSSVRDGDGHHSFIPSSRQSITGRSQGDSRPNSRTSYSSHSSLSQGGFASALPQPRPDSRQSLGRSRTPLGHYSTNPTTESRRPRSSLSSYAGHSQLVSGMEDIDENYDITTPTPRRSMIEPDALRSSIPNAGGLKKRPSGTASAIPTPRRISSGIDRQLTDPRVPTERAKKLSDLGETY